MANRSRLLRGNSIPELMVVVGFTVVSVYKNTFDMVNSFYAEGTVLRSSLEWLALTVSLVILTSVLWQVVTLIVWN